MAAIDTLYVVNHSHTDIGFTDYQDLCFRQHVEFIDQALDLIEATQDYPEEARYRWTCEVTGMTEKWFREAPPAQIDRFKRWHERGYIDVAGMQYNHTPMQNAGADDPQSLPGAAAARRTTGFRSPRRCSATSTASAGSLPTFCRRSASSC